MKIVRNNRFKRDYKKLSFEIQKRTEEKLIILSQNLAHPSLRIKKIKKTTNIFEASITKNYRFLFEINKNEYILHRIGTHNILDKL